MHDNIRLYHVDHLGSTSLVTDIDGEITQHVAYIPYGEVFVEQRNGSWNTPYLFNAKELDEETGLYYYGARYLDPTHAAWLSVDPLFEKYVGMTPYNYCAGNPVKLVDVDGRSMSLEGEESAVMATFDQYNNSTSLELTIKDGIIDAKGEAKTEADKKLLEAIKDENVTVHIKATYSKSLDNGKWYVGGAFHGSKKDENGKVDAYQTVNPSMTATCDEVMGNTKGVSALHEALEAYIGATDSPGTGNPTFDQNSVEYKNYKSAHDKAMETDPRFRAPNVEVTQEGEVRITKWNTEIPLPDNYYTKINHVDPSKR